MHSLGDLVTWVKNNLIRERHDMFTVGNRLRPGLFVLVNGEDWELSDTIHYKMQPNDRISFISTLHGG